MAEDRITKAIYRGCRTHITRRPASPRVPAGLIRNAFRTSPAQEDLDDKARWLDGQVRGWTAGRTL
jgi:hypothetical protein